MRAVCSVLLLCACLVSCETPLQLLMGCRRAVHAAKKIRHGAQQRSTLLFNVQNIQMKDPPWAQGTDVRDPAITTAPQSALLSLPDAVTSLQRLAATLTGREQTLAMYTLGLGLSELKRYSDAQAVFRTTLHGDPAHVAAALQLAAMSQQLGQHDLAVHILRQVVRAVPHERMGQMLACALLRGGYWGEHHLLVTNLMSKRRGRSYSRTTDWWADNTTAHGVVADPRFQVESLGLTNQVKLEHDADQLEYLIRTSRLPGSQFSAVAAAIRQVSASLSSRQPAVPCADCGPRTVLYALTAKDRDQMAQLYNRVLHIPQALALLPAAALAPRALHERHAIEQQYFDTGPLSVVHVDNILSAETLRRLRKFCTEGTIYFELKRGERYLGAYLHDGFSTPLLYQVAEELRSMFPRIFNGHSLMHAWAYVYDDANGTAGIGLHGDEAAVNVNLWITPSEANLDPDSGGLVVHKVGAPTEWSFDDFNSPDNRKKLEAEVARERRHAVVVPYRANRITIFNSSMFHETDSFTFKRGFLSRRINLTFLFGERLS